MRDLLTDTRYGVRILRKSPGFAVVAVLALALGIGANMAIFSAVDTVLLRPLPYTGSDHLVMVWEDASHQSFPRNTPAPGNYFDWKKQNSVFTDMAALRNASANLTGDGEAPELAQGRGVTANFFSVLGIQPMLGRAFTADEDRQGAKVVVLTNGLWQRRYGGDPAIVNRTIQMNGESRTVLGVMPPGFYFPDRQNAFFGPAGLDAQVNRRDSHFLAVVARLKQGVSVRNAQTEMQVIAQRLAAEHPDTNTRIGAVVVPLREQIAGDSRTALLVLLAAAGCVLLICCSNLANLLLAKSAVRQREFAVRGALGAPRLRLIRQMLTESAILAALGGLVGLGFGYTGLRLLESLVPSGAPGSSLTMDARVLAFSLVLTGVTALLFGLLPALRAARVDLNEALKQGSRGGIGGKSRVIRSGLVIAEVALAIVLLVGAGLMVETLRNLRQTNLGFRPDHLLTLRLGLSPIKYGNQQKRAAFYQAVLDRVQALPGVKSAAFGGNLPFTSFGNTYGYSIEGRPDPGPGNAQDALYRPITRDYFKTLGIILKEGRLFTPEDHAGSELALVISDYFARLHWGEKSPLGARIRFGDRFYTVVGVVKDVRERGIDAPQKPAMYPMIEQVNANGGAFLAVQTASDPLLMAKTVSEAIWAVDNDQPISALRSMETILESQVSNRSLQMMLLTIFAGLALLLASLGVYGLLSYLVTQRIREVGLRMALGASVRQVVWMFAKQGVGLTAAGLVTGIAASALAARAMKTMLYGVAPTDVRVYLAVCATLTLVALLACYLPARRAARVDPMMTLREE